MVIQYSLVGVVLPHPIKFYYPVNLQEFLLELITGLNYPVKFPYPVKASMRKSSYFSKYKIISCRNHQV